MAKNRDIEELQNLMKKEFETEKIVPRTKIKKTMKKIMEE